MINIHYHHVHKHHGHKHHHHHVHHKHPKVVQPGIAQPRIQVANQCQNMERSILDRINQVRAQHGLSALTMNAELSHIARTHSQNMTSKKVAFGHEGVQERFKLMQNKVHCHSMAENVAYTYNKKDPVSTTVDGWIKSSGHFANIKGNYNLTGIGVTTDGKGTYYFTQLFGKV